MCESVYQSAMCWEFSELMHDAMPEFYIAAGADRQAPHRVQDAGLKCEQAGRGQHSLPD